MYWNYIVKWFLFLHVSGSTELSVCKHETIPAKEWLGFSSSFHFFTSYFLFCCLIQSQFHPLFCMFDAFASAGCGCFDSLWEHLIFCLIHKGFFCFVFFAPSSILHMDHFPRGHIMETSVFIKDKWPTKAEAGGFLPYDVQMTPATVKAD